MLMMKNNNLTYRNKILLEKNSIVTTIDRYEEEFLEKIENYKVKKIDNDDVYYYDKNDNIIFVHTIMSGLFYVSRT